MVACMFVVLVGFIWAKLEGKNSCTKFIFLFQCITTLFSFVIFKEKISVLLILLFSFFDIYMYFIINSHNKKRCHKIKKRIKKICESNYEPNLVQDIINLNNFGYINFKTKKIIICIETLIVLLSIGEIYA